MREDEGTFQDAMTAIIGRRSAQENPEMGDLLEDQRPAQTTLMWLASAAVSVTLVGCAAGSPEASGSVQRDSAGVTITESWSPAWSEGGGWSVNHEPVLDLARSGSGAAHEFYRVQDAIRLRDGSIIVADGGSNQLRFFSAAGEFVRAVGGAGEGPGEFERLTSVHALSDDRILAFDFWLGRLTVFASDGEVARTFQPFGSETRVRRVEVLSDGTVIGVTYSSADLPTELGLYRLPFTIVRFDLAGTSVDTVAVIPGTQGFVFEEGDARPLFARSGHMATDGDHVYLGDADSMQVSVKDGHGRLRRVMRIPGFDLSVSRSDLDAERRALLPADAPPTIRDVVASLPDPRTRPAYSDLLVDSEKFVWAPRASGIAETADPTECVIFGPDGRWMGSVLLPPGFRLFEVGTDYVLGVMSGGFDVEHVQLLSVNRPPFE